MDLLVTVEEAFLGTRMARCNVFGRALLCFDYGIWFGDERDIDSSILTIVALLLYGDYGESTGG